MSLVILRREAQGRYKDK